LALSATLPSPVAMSFRSSGVLLEVVAVLLRELLRLADHVVEIHAASGQ
jgi:hypothetical protein